MSITSFTNADKISSIVANSNTSPMAGYNFSGMKGILHLGSNQYRNVSSINAQYLGIRDVHFLNRSIYQGNIYTGIVPSGLKYLNLTSNALSTEAIDGILVSMEIHARKNGISNGEIYLWGGSSGWNQFPSEIGYAARKSLIESPSSNWSGILSISGTASPGTGIFITLNGKVNSLILTGSNLSGNILSIVNKSPSFSDQTSTYTVTPLINNSCLFTRNLNGAPNSGGFTFYVSGIGLGNAPLTGKFFTLGPGGKSYGNWRVGINRWVEAHYGRGETRTNTSLSINTIDIISDILNKKYITLLKPNQTLNVGLINYISRGVANTSFNARIDLVDAAVLNTNIATTYTSYVVASRILTAERVDNCAGNFIQYYNGTIGQYSYGHGFSYESTNENYRYSGCPFHSSLSSCTASSYGGSGSASLLSPYPFDGNTVECPIDCITNTFGKNVLVFFHGPATCFNPPTIFFDDSIAFNIKTYSPDINCGTNQGFSSAGQSRVIINKFSVVEPNQGNVCSQRAISRDHARII